MKPQCPLCHTGYLEEVHTEGQSLIQCSEYPACRFATDTWENMTQTAARFHHPVTPGQ